MHIPSNEILDSFLTAQRQEVKAALMELAVELAAAERKHSRWPTDLIHRAGIVSEEAGELMQAALQWQYERGSVGDCEKEAVHTGATCLRFIMNIQSASSNNTLQ